MQMIDTIRLNVIPNQRNIRPIVLESSRIKYWVEIILNAYKKIMNTKWAKNSKQRINKSRFVLGMLTWMKQGYKEGDYDIIEKDHFLSWHLPDIKDFSAFGFDEKKVNCGKTMIQCAIINIRQELSVYELQFRSTL